MIALALALVLLGTAAWAGYLVGDLRHLPSPAQSAVERPSVSAVIPARDEESSLPRLLRSLEQLDYPPEEVVVVDDGSRDRTAEVAISGGAHVVQAEAPPAGWTGKAWASRSGVENTTGDLLLFLDADTELAPHALAALVEAHRQRGGLVSVQPFHDAVRPHEQLSAYFNLVSMMASSAFTPRPSRAPMAFGPCLLTSRADLAHAGGHDAVRSDVLDDAALAAAYLRAGLPVWCAAGGSDVRMRSYPESLSQLVAGWTKNIAAGASTASLPAAAGTVAWVAAHHAVAVGTLAAVTTTVTGSLTTGSPLLWVVAYLLFAWQIRALLSRIGSFRWWAWALFPVPLLAFDLIFARSAVLTLVRRSVRWRGRHVDLRRPGSTEEVA